MSKIYIWYKNGRPSKESFDPEGLHVVKQYNPDGSFKRIVYYGEYDINGRSTDFTRIQQEWVYASDNILDRDGPYCLGYHNNGVIEYKAWLDHVENRASQLKYDKAGVLIFEEYTKSGVLHRTNGPASITYKDGVVETEEYWFDGLKFVHKEEWEEFINGIETED